MRRESRPSVIALAGPNGAGKSTVGPGLLRGALRVTEFVNADVIAQGLSAFDPDAGRGSDPPSVRDQATWARLNEEWAR